MTPSIDKTLLVCGGGGGVWFKGKKGDYKTLQQGMHASLQKGAIYNSEK